MKRLLFLALFALAGCNETAPEIKAWSTGGPVVMTFPSAPPSFYAPTALESNGGTILFVTNGDRVARYQSLNAINWMGGDIVLSAAKGTWEDDGGSFMGYTTGISNPTILKNATNNSLYTMYYNAGPMSTGGGLGIATSNDGLVWTKFNENPIRTAPGGAIFQLNAMTIRGKKYLFYAGGGDLAKGIGPHLIVADDTGDGLHFTNDRAPPGLPTNAYPLFYDEAADSCWIALGFVDTPPPSGPAGFDIYKDSDCFTTMGIKIATIDPSTTGNPTNFDPQALNRGERGQRIGTGDVQIIFSTGNQWGSWKPASIIIKAP